MLHINVMFCVGSKTPCISNVEVMPVLTPLCLYSTYSSCSCSTLTHLQAVYLYLMQLINSYYLDDLLLVIVILMYAVTEAMQNSSLSCMYPPPPF